MFIDDERLSQLNELQNAIGYKFKDIILLNSALIHKSFSNENSGLKGLDNERLEFLGDAVLELVFSEILFTKFSRRDEGFLTKLRASLVCEPSFYNFSKKFNLSKYILLGKGEEQGGGRNKPSIVSDAFEALAGAIYLDSGYDEVSKFIKELISEELLNINIKSDQVKDFKSTLQEYIHKSENINIQYKLIEEKGPSHQKTFYMSAYKGPIKISDGVGNSKKEAEQDAAKNALIKYKQI